VLLECRMLRGTLRDMVATCRQCTCRQLHGLPWVEMLMEASWFSSPASCPVLCAFVDVSQVWDAVAQRIPERARWIEELAAGGVIVQL
jgi:hypothetical protein